METSPLPYGPELERTYLTAGLDYYKPTMSQLAYEVEPHAEVTFTFKNRGEQRLADYVNPTDLQARFDSIREYGFNDQELSYLASPNTSKGESVFQDSYIEHLRNGQMPSVSVTMEDDDIAIETTGEWSLVSFWETVVMSEVNEMYFEGYVRSQGLDIFEVYNTGDNRLTDKIETLKANPDIKIVDFGTRRHFSHRWQAHVLKRLLAECPDNILGTSNVALALANNIKPIGTFAHEMPMTYAGLADARGEDVKASHNRFLTDWYERYGTDLSTVLTDTFGSDFFFSDFTPEQAAQWRALRHDSGDPVEFGEKALAFYEASGVDAKTKTIVFSDGLDINEIVRLHGIFKDRINVVFGWGTTLTNDLGLKPLNIVMKATHVKDTLTGQEADEVKLSDNPGKHTGPKSKVNEYQVLFDAAKSLKRTVMV